MFVHNIQEILLHKFFGNDQLYFHRSCDQNIFEKSN